MFQPPTTQLIYSQEDRQHNNCVTSRLWLYGPSWLPLDTQWPTWSPTNVLSIQTEETTDTASDSDFSSDMEQSQTHGPHCVIDASR